MGKPYEISITNGSGQEKVLNGAYSVTANVTGYENASINPSTLNVVSGTDTYNFTISASGTLTLHVTEDGTSSGTPVVGATFIRTDSTGTEYGTSVTSDAEGNAVFENMPYAASDAPTIYYKQTASDGEHEFDNTVKSTTMTSETATLEITNAVASNRTISLTDANYDNLPIQTGSITLS